MSSIQLAILCTLFVAVCGHPGLEFRSFWNGLSTEQQAQVKQLVNDVSLTKNQAQAKIEEWVNGLGDEKVKAAFTAMKSKIEEFKNKMPEMANKLSADAQAVMKQIREVHTNEGLSFKDTCERINSIINGASDSIKSEIKFMQPKDCSKGMFSEFIPGQPAPQKA